MNYILELSKFYLLSVGFGVFIFAPVANSKMTGGGFQKLLTTVCLSSIFGAIICHVVMGKSLANIEGAILVVSSICLLFHRQLHNTHDEKNSLLWLLYAIPAALGIVEFYFYQTYTLRNYLFIMSSAYYLGAITYAMILGHWYLVTPKLSEKPLKVATLIMWAIMIPKIIWSFYEASNASAYLELGTMLGGGYSFNWIMFIMRGVWGYLVIGVMSYFGWRLVCMRSIQSATGIYYSMTIFVFIGELISSYLFFKFGLLI
ncbi:hypothetical protein [Bacteriovorax sp. Seq25_V]|uniref:hypothetical protein n=1 Tax=Bacteriovorax sp. Seq25_V TaxID=1201288 RepID=UPI00038A5558|nr:hypothetical protein [Bacteriovorax sp. Seq25_V]EQC46884.1 putative membrane protein [Bacteriovorax sp. Seq25_V]